MSTKDMPWISAHVEHDPYTLLCGDFDGGCDGNCGEGGSWCDGDCNG